MLLSYSSSELTFLACSFTSIRVCSVWDHSLEKKSGRCPVAWEVASPLWGSLAVHRTLHQLVTAGVPSVHSWDTVRAASCLWFVGERGAVWLGTRVTSIGVTLLPPGPAWAMCSCRTVNTGLWAGSCGSGCSFSAQSQRSHSCRALRCQRPPLGPAVPEEHLFPAT